MDMVKKLKAFRKQAIVNQLPSSVGMFWYALFMVMFTREREKCVIAPCLLVLIATREISESRKNVEKRDLSVYEMG